jgi:D-serine deaminase-like pyridoxal phosphate-dependent protein
MSNKNWYELNDLENVISPSLLVYPDRIEKNIQQMVSMAGDHHLLRPHVKTHKTAEIIKMQMNYGINKFKCATIAEAELLAQCGAGDILLAMQPVGVNIQRFISLIKKFPDSKFSTLVDNNKTLGDIGVMASKIGMPISLWIDINSGMNRTGIKPNVEAINLYVAIEDHPFLKAEGLHVYDGHIHNSDISERKEVCDVAFESVLELKNAIEKKGLTIDTIVAGGSPSFPIHAGREKVETSPGTTLLWDARYAQLFPDMDFLLAAVLFIRVISKPAPNILCFDLGHKMIASEMDFPRLQIFGLEGSIQVGQSEEHLIVETSRASDFEVGDAFYAIPMHICPTVAKYEKLITIKSGEITGFWNVAARNQKITI